MNSVYTAWWQGFDKAPKIIRMCHSSLLHAADACSAQVISITDKNLDDYIDWPGKIVDKYRKGIIPAAHYSDLLRFSLLRNHGGIWSDASMYFNKPLQQDWFEKELFTFAREAPDSKRITNRWLMSFIGGQRNFPLFGLLTDFWIDYWMHEDDLIAYLITDNIMYLGYNTNKSIHEAFNKCPRMTLPVDYFERRLGTIFSSDTREKLEKNDGCFKLTYKQDFPEAIHGNLTLYGHLLKEQGIE
ncbi:capsular polysaccharide synthesis protein [Bifidobacterium eulemuris]|uniref:Capsular biosynthesis protein n=1 Tax=Bifidobacterium eulemuris TaxID=1765219 RepID=A0A261G548_9BIFI|nr:capsular polysaccharide synthesis protein [Bifidobacterium eulemuris]OZG66567.1 capsular biosynthesis protein [Bifidobacterium eulemuris]QOL32650.1 hypothetical protein BE0216_09550 [Bifidobacterium eulemuris]